MEGKKKTSYWTSVNILFTVKYSVTIMLSGVIYAQKCLLDTSNEIIDQISIWTFQVFLVRITLQMVVIKHIPHSPPSRVRNRQ